MAKYSFHISEDGKPRKCSTTPEACPVKGPDGEKAPHIESTRLNSREVTEFAEKINSGNAVKSGFTLEGQKKPIDTVRYSFLNEFKKLETEFNEDFAGLSTRFFNADLRGKFYPRDKTDQYLELEETTRIFEVNRRIANQLLTKERFREKIPSHWTQDEIDDWDRAQAITHERMLEGTARTPIEGLRAKWESKLEQFNKRYSHQKLSARLTSFASQTSDLGLSTPETVKLLENAGYTDIQEVTDRDTLRQLGKDGVDGGFYAKGPLGEQIFVSNGNVAGRNFSSYSFRSRSNRVPFEATAFTMIDKRSLAGSARIERLTGVNILQEATSGNTDRYDVLKPGDKAIYEANRDRKAANKEKILSAMKSLEDSQQRGKNFKSQQKYYKDQQSKIAGVFDDKKHAKETHVEAARKSSLMGSFRKIEIDNDVNLEEFAKFEADYNEIVSKLPPVPKDRQPELRVRYLGKHNAKGLFSPAHNAVAIDVRDSGSTIHEMGHYYDLVVKNNASLNRDFNSIVGEYESTLKVPLGSGRAASPEYYSTPTEVFARGFELYAHEKLGVTGNRLLKEDKLSNFDYDPFNNNPSLKARMFAALDNVFKQ